MIRRDSSNLRRFLLWLACTALALVHGAAAEAQVIEIGAFDLDFTHPDTVKGRVETFPTDLKMSTKGLGYDEQTPATLPVMHFLTTQPTALGSGWTTVSNVTIHARLKVDFKDNGMYALGNLYLRYSPDAVHWSTWQNTTGGTRAHKASLVHTYEGRLSVPDIEQEPYFDLLKQFYKAEPEQTGNEQAAVRWITKRDAHYFEKTLPFIGYIDFLFETSLNSGQHIKSLHCAVIWSYPGLYSGPARGPH